MGRINIRDRILYVYMYTGYIMAKLYWRYKKLNGTWTWKAAELNPAGKQGIWVLVRDYNKEEQE